MGKYNREVQELGPPHPTKPLEIQLEESGARHRVADFEGKDYATDAATLKANQFQTAKKLNDLIAALAAMGVPIGMPKET